MSTTSSRPNFFADQMVSVGVPLIVIATLAERLGASVGSASTIAAAVLAATVATVVQHFGSRAIMRAAGSTQQDLRFYALLGGVNAAISALSVATVASTLGF